MITNENCVGVSSNGANELMKNVKINMSLTGWSAASAIIVSAVCVSTTVICWIKTREKLESKKMKYCYEDHAKENLEMAIR